MEEGGTVPALTLSPLAGISLGEERGAGGAGGLGCDGAQGYRVQQYVMVMRWGGIEWTLIENQEHSQTSWVTEHDAGAWEQQGDMSCQHSPAGTWGS